MTTKRLISALAMLALVLLVSSRTFSGLCTFILHPDYGYRSRFSSCRSRHSPLIPALPFCHLTLKAERPKSPLYPDELITYGDHLRARRLDAGLSQRQAAEAIGVDETSVFNWESNRVEPAVRLIPGIIRFLGYCPYAPAPPITGWLKLIRRSMGFTQERMAETFGVDESTWRGWEAGRRQPSSEYRERIKAFLASSAMGEFNPATCQH